MNDVEQPHQTIKRLELQLAACQRDLGKTTQERNDAIDRAKRAERERDELRRAAAPQPILLRSEEWMP